MGEVYTTKTPCSPWDCRLLHQKIVPDCQHRPQLRSTALMHSVEDTLRQGGAGSTAMTRLFSSTMQAAEALLAEAKLSQQLLHDHVCSACC